MRKELCRGIYQNIQKQGKLPQNLAKYKNNSLKRKGWTRMDKFKRRFGNGLQLLFLLKLISATGFQSSFVLFFETF